MANTAASTVPEHRSPLAPANAGDQASKVIKLDITSDAICPFCYLGLRKIQSAIKKTKETHPDVEFQIKFEPFLLDPTLDDKPTNKRERYIAKFGGAERVKAMETAMIQRGKEVEPPINFSYGGVVRQTHDAHRLLTLAYKQGGEARQLALLEKLFKGYFEEEKDIGDHAFLASSAVDAGVFPSEDEAKNFLTSSDLLPELQSAYAKAQSLGISGVPFTVVDGKYGISGAQEVDTFAGIFAKLVKGEKL